MKLIYKNKIQLDNDKRNKYQNPTENVAHRNNEQIITNIYTKYSGVPPQIRDLINQEITYYNYKSFSEMERPHKEKLIAKCLAYWLTIDFNYAQEILAYGEIAQDFTKGYVVAWIKTALGENSAQSIFDSMYFNAIEQLSETLDDYFLEVISDNEAELRYEKRR